MMVKHSKPRKFKWIQKVTFSLSDQGRKTGRFKQWGPNFEHPTPIFQRYRVKRFQNLFKDFLTPFSRDTENKKIWNLFYYTINTNRIYTNRATPQLPLSWCQEMEKVTRIVTKMVTTQQGARHVLSLSGEPGPTGLRRFNFIGFVMSFFANLTYSWRLIWRKRLKS